jgi:hypothetical protein
MGLVGAGEADIDWDVTGASGYRSWGVDYSNDDGFVFDVVQQGPILGMVVRF